MSNVDALAGVYNVVTTDRRCADHRVPVSEFVRRLEARDVPDQLCVVGLGDTVDGDPERAERLATAMRESVDFLNGRRPLPAIQFCVEGDLRVTGDRLEIVDDGETHQLDQLFSRAPRRRAEGWFVVPYRV
jgi:hypothetical protein